MDSVAFPELLCDHVHGVLSTREAHLTLGDQHLIEAWSHKLGKSPSPLENQLIPTLNHPFVQSPQREALLSGRTFQGLGDYLVGAYKQSLYHLFQIIFSQTMICFESQNSFNNWLRVRIFNEPSILPDIPKYLVILSFRITSSKPSPNISCL